MNVYITSTRTWQPADSANDTILLMYSSHCSVDSSNMNLTKPPLLHCNSYEAWKSRKIDLIKHHKQLERTADSLVTD